MYEELPSGVIIADLLHDGRVQAVLRKLAPVVGGGETEQMSEPYCMDDPELHVVA